MRAPGVRRLRQWRRPAARRARVPWGRYQPPCAPALRPRVRLDLSVLARADWPAFWAAAVRPLRAAGLRAGTLRVYRQVLRSFRGFLQARRPGARPGCVTPRLAREFLYGLERRQASASWTGTHITALRTVFDKVGGAGLTTGLPTPKRPQRLHDVLSAEEVGRMVRAARTTPERLAILLLYGCGLRVCELCALRWADVDVAGSMLTVRFAGGTRERRVVLPRNALVLLRAESCCRACTDVVFAGARAGKPMSVRTAERMVRRAAVGARIVKEANARTLRRSYAVQSLRDGMDVVELCGAMGHVCLDSTLAYGRYLLSPAVSALRDRPLPYVAGSCAAVAWPGVPACGP